MSDEMILEPTLNQAEEEEEVQVKPFARPADRAASGSRVQAVSVAREAEEIPAGFFRRLSKRVNHATRFLRGGGIIEID